MLGHVKEHHSWTLCPPFNHTGSFYRMARRSKLSVNDIILFAMPALVLGHVEA